VSGVLWTPAVERGRLWSWWDPSDVRTLTMASGKVSAIADKGPWNMTLSQATDSRRPVRAWLRGRACLEVPFTDNSTVDTTEACLEGTINASAPLDPDYSVIWAVVEAPDADQSGAIVKLGSDTTGYGIGMGSSTWDSASAAATVVSLREQVTWEVPVGSFVLRNECAIYGFQTQGSVTTLWKRSRNGHPAFERYDPARVNVLDYEGAARLFGYVADAGGPQPRYWAGKIGEVIVVPDSRNAPLCRRIEGYLSAKWGIRLQPGHPYYNRAPLAVGGSLLRVPSRTLRPALDLSVNGWSAV